MASEIENQLFPPNSQGLFIVQNHPVVIALNKKEKRDAYLKKYRESEKYKSYQKAYRISPTAKILQKGYQKKFATSPKRIAYNKSEKMLEYHRNYMRNYTKTPKWRAYQKEYRQTDKAKAWKTAYTQLPSSKVRAQQYQVKYNITPKAKIRTERWRNSEKGKTYQKTFRDSKEGKEYQRLYNRKYIPERMKTDPRYRMMKTLRNRSHYIKKLIGNPNIHSNARPIANYLGAPPIDGKEHHMHHKIPFNSVNLFDPKQVKIVTAPENLQWITKEEHIKQTNIDRKKYKNISYGRKLVKK
jgi:hypothetical protein